MVMEAADLQPLLDAKTATNAAHRGTPSKEKELKPKQRIVKQAAVCTAKTVWVCKVAGEAEAAEKDSLRK